jgi:CRISPR-associated exonuclease Cas4
LFYGKTRRRLDVPFDQPLRTLTCQTIDRLHELIANRRTPAAIYDKTKCERCSLISLCMPKIASRRIGAGGYLAAALSLALANGASSD